MVINVIIKKYKTFFRVDIQLYQHEWKLEKRENVFTQFRVFPVSTSVDITVYQYGKNVLYLFYNRAMSKPEGYEKFPCLQVAGNFPCLH